MKAKKIRFLVVDLFCGAGGTTLGYESAKSIDKEFKLAAVIACVNHDHLAIKSHWANHPQVEHFEEDIRLLDPYGRLKRLVDIYRAFYPEAKVVLWASLECTNFSKAKGGLPRDADSRTLAEHLYKYIHALDPDYIKIENVVEFMSWGPLDENGKPISRKNGSDWVRWRETIKSFGYMDEWREMNAANFGALTSRNRLFGCFARPGLPIVFPTPTHTKRPEQTQIEKPLKKWRAVKEALDFQDEGKSIFNRKKNLSPKTMQRLFMGCVKHIAGGKDLFLTKFYSGRPEQKSASIDDPSPSITTFGGGGLVKIDRFIAKHFSGSPEDKSSSVEAPLSTITTKDHNSLVFLTKWNSNNQKTGGNNGHSVDEPAPVVTTQNRLGVTFLSDYNGVNGGKHDNSKSIEGPAGAITAGDRHAKVTANFIQLYYSGGGQSGSIDDPAGTIPTHDRLSKVQADFFLEKKYQGEHNHQSIERPAGTILTNDKHNLIRAEKFIMPGGFDKRAKSIEDPAPTLTASRHHHYLVNPSWGGASSSVESPCVVVIARQDKAPLYLISCKEGPIAVPVYEDDDEYTVKLKEFMALYNICDIKMRMLKVIELKVIQGFPIDYILHGNQTDQKKFIGNAVEKHVVQCWSEALDLKLAA
jgi:DNA (cytosine-5)-methyltransferase 1